MSGRRIARTKTIDGVVTPAFIRNGPFHFVNLQVYADGLVDCWELLDLELFNEKLRSGWVRTSVPDGEEVHVHGLGAWTIVDGRWAVTPEDMFRRVTERVRELNPRMENLHNCHGRTVEKIGNVNVLILGSPREEPVRFSGPEPFAKRIKGDHISALVRADDALYLADVRAFADGTIEIGRLPCAETLSFDQFEKAVADGRICSSVAAGTRIEIHELGSFAVQEELWCTDIDDILRSIPDLIDSASGRPDSVKRCRAAYDAYLADPTEATRAALRSAYEAVPSQNRVFVGDMDTKDIPVRMIVYGDEEIEGWSHRLVAREQGTALPTLTVPKPKDK